MQILRGALTAMTSLLLADASVGQHAELEEVVIYASPLQQSAMDLAQSAVVLAGDDLTLSIAGSLGESLAAVPGVTASYFGPKASRPIIRGLSGERVLMLLDGVSALDVSNLSPDHSVGVEPILADQIEILKGPSTLLYGSGAVGGVVNVVDGRLPRRDIDELAGSAEFRGDSASGEFSAAGRLDGRAGDFALHFDAYDRSTDDIEIPGFAWSRAARDAAAQAGAEPDLSRGRVRNSDSDTTGGAAGASWVGENFLVGLAWSRHETNYGLPGPGEAEEETVEAMEAAAIRIDQVQDRLDFKTQWTPESGFVENVLVRAAVSDYEHAELEGAEVGTRFDQTGLDARLHVGHRPIAGWNGTVGMQYADSELEAVGAEAYVPPSTTSTLSAFVIEQRTFGPLTTDLGLRIEQQRIDTDAELPDYSASAATVAAGLLWPIGADLSAAAHLTRSERHPQASELYSNGPHLAVQRFEIGDAALDTEAATTLDVGLRSEGDVHWHVSLFYSEFRDYIYASPTGIEEDGLPVFQYTQADASFHGMEIDIEVPLIEQGERALALRLGGDYVRGTLDRGGDLPQMPPLRLLTTLEFDAGGWHAALDLQWFDDQDRTASNELATDGGTLLGAEVSWRWSRWDPGVLFFARATNLLDEEIRRHTSPLKEYLPLPGRSLGLGVRASF